MKSYGVGGFEREVRRDNGESAIMPHRPPWGRGEFGPTAGRDSVVRLFPDYAGSVLWFPHPVDYAATGLDGGLVADLIRWEIDYYDALDADFDWRSPDLARAFTTDGVALAYRLAVQLGAAFDIEFASYEAGVATRRFRSELPADNPRAAAAFTALAGSHARPAVGSSSVIWPAASRASQSVSPSRPRNASSWLTTSRPPR
jgi:hypothetical protein